MVLIPPLKILCDTEERRRDEISHQLFSSSESDISEALLQGRTSLNSSSDHCPESDSETITLFGEQNTKQIGLIETENLSALTSIGNEGLSIPIQPIEEIAYDYNDSESFNEPIISGSGEFSIELNPPLEVKDGPVRDSKETPPLEITETAPPTIKDETEQRLDINNNIEPRVFERVMENNKQSVCDSVTTQMINSHPKTKAIWMNENVPPFLYSNIIEAPSKTMDTSKPFEKFGFERQKEPERLSFLSEVLVSEKNQRKTSDQERKEIRIDIPQAKIMTTKKDLKQIRMDKDKTAQSIVGLGVCAFVVGGFFYLLSNES